MYSYSLSFPGIGPKNNAALYAAAWMSSEESRGHGCPWRAVNWHDGNDIILVSLMFKPIMIPRHAEITQSLAQLFNGFQ